MAPDTIDPAISNGPSDIITVLPSGQTTVPVEWTEPTAVDNITPTDEITVVSSHNPGQEFPVGTTPVTYIFTDRAGNEVTYTFNVIVQRELCMLFVCLFVALFIPLLFCA